jgi:hypothetical protein
MNNQKKTVKRKTRKRTNEKKTLAATLMGRPSIASTRAERGSVPLMAEHRVCQAWALPLWLVVVEQAYQRGAPPVPCPSPNSELPENSTRSRRRESVQESPVQDGRQFLGVVAQVSRRHPSNIHRFSIARGGFVNSEMLIGGIVRDGPVRAASSCWTRRRWTWCQRPTGSAASRRWSSASSRSTCPSVSSSCALTIVFCLLSLVSLLRRLAQIRPHKP